jgi:UDP-N-acetylmuramate dehydrogenase
VIADVAMDPQALERLALALGSRAVRDAPLGGRTTYRVGGTASLLVEAGDFDALVACHVALSEAATPIPVVVVGKGSNMLVSDSGFPGLAIYLTGEFASVEIEDTRVRAGAAVGLQNLARQTANLGLTGFEWAVGVPGTVGGATRMNAGGHGSQMADVLVSAGLFDLATGEPAVRAFPDLDFGYRHSSVGPADVVTHADLRLEMTEPSEALSKIADVVAWRQAHQPGGSNAGSVFTNPSGDSAGRLIDEAGLKGKRIGTAEVSAKHANFIQADRHGSADDVRALIDHVRAGVLASQGVELVPELVMVGFAGESLPMVEVSTSTSGSGLGLESSQ